MKKDNLLSEYSVAELQKRYRLTKMIVLGLIVAMVVLIIVIINSLVMSEKKMYGLLAIPFGLIALIGINVIAMKAIEKEIASRK